MIFYVVGSVFETPIPLCNIRNKQMLHYTLCVFIEVFGELNLAFQYLLINGHRVVIVEWINSSKHFVSQNTKGPPVNRLSVTLVQQNFWRQVLWSSAQRIGSGFAVFCKTKICKFQIAFLIDQNVFGLEIPVDYI